MPRRLSVVDGRPTTEYAKNGDVHIAYQVAGVDPTKLRDALLAAWKGDYPDMKTTTTTIGGKDITKGDFGADADSSYLFIKDGVVYDVETSDAGIAEAARGTRFNFQFPKAHRHKSPVPPPSIPGGGSGPRNSSAALTPPFENGAPHAASPISTPLNVPASIRSLKSPR